MAKGDVTYELRADDSKLESDINEANKKVEKAVEKSADKTVKIEEQKTAKLKEESDKNVKNAEQATEKIADAWIDAGKDAEKAMDIDIKEKGITVDVKADTSNAENKIKGVSRDKSIDVDVNADVSDAEDSIEGLGDTAEKVGSKMGDAIGNVGGGLKSAFSDEIGRAHV